MEWSLLPPATKEMETQTSVVKGRFMGDYTELNKSIFTIFSELTVK